MTLTPWLILHQTLHMHHSRGAAPSELRAAVAAFHLALLSVSRSILFLASPSFLFAACACSKDVMSQRLPKLRNL